MTPELWVSLGGALISAAAAVICAKVGRKQDAEAERQEHRAARREKESRLSMDMMSASIKLGNITAIALAGGHLNGNVEEAREAALAAAAAYDDFLKDEAAHQIAKV